MSHGRDTVVKRGPGRPPRHSYVAFAFKTGDLVLVKWNDGMVYFAKIKRIDHKRRKCVVVFDDKSQDEAHFSQIHSVDETTTDIICIKCKKDDSDKPNEIVLCDTCGIGFHQKCHMPNIPASALELDTPWNCSYCQKGIKCPYLTESLDVLQNLLSEDEDNSVADDLESTAAVDSDHFEVISIEEFRQAPPRKRRGRKSAATVASTSEATMTAPAKREKRKLISTITTNQSSSIVTMDSSSRTAHVEGWKTKTYIHDESDNEPVYISSGKSTPEPASHIGVKRKKHRVISPNQVKKKKRSSVESRTVSVTRQTMPICENSSAEEMDTSRDSSVCEVTPVPVANHELSSIKEERRGLHEKRPRSLRVSLSIPDDVEPGTPFDKVVKAHQKMTSPHHGVEMKELPSWENFADTNVLKTSLPKQRPQTLPTEKFNNILPSKNLSATSIMEESSLTTKSTAQSPSAFLASPLPISSSSKLKSPVALPATTAETNMKTKITGSSSVDDNLKGTSAAAGSTPVAVGYSSQLLSGQKLATAGSSVTVAARPSTLVVRSTQSESVKLQPLKGPPQSRILLHCQPQPSAQSQSNNFVKTVHPPYTVTPGTTQPSINSPLSLATKPVSLPTGAPAPSPSAKNVVPTHQQATPLPLQQQPELVSQSPVHPSSSSSTSPKPTSTPTPKQVILTQSHLSSQKVIMASSPQLQNVATHQQTMMPGSQRPNVPQAQHILTAPSSRPSSVPMQQKVVVNPPPRPSSVPIQQQRQVLVTQSSSRSPSVQASQRVPVGQSQHQSPVTVQQIVVTQPHYVAKGQPAIQHTSSLTSIPRTSVLSPLSTASSVSPTMVHQRPTQEQLQQVVTARKTSSAKSGGDADVIITGVESTRVNVGNEPVTQHGGERVVLVNSPANEAMVAYQQVATSMGPAAGTVLARKVITRPADFQQVVSASSNHPGSQVTPVASHTPVSMVPVVLTPTSNLSSTQVLYHLSDPQAPPQVISGEAPVCTPPLRSTSSTRPPTSVIVACSPTVTTGNIPVANSPISALPASTIYTAVGQNVSGFSSVTTTKPFAIVSAMPGTQIVYTASQGIQPSQGGVATVPAGSLPHPPKTYSLLEKQNVPGGKLHHRDVVQTISKKIGDAFNSGNEQLLVAAFDDAWKRFQANGRQYEHGVITSFVKTSSGKEPPPPNAEVITVPGTGSRVSIVRQTGNGGNRLLTPKTTSPVQVQQMIAPPPLSSQGQAKYVYTAASAAQPRAQQVYLQPVTVSSAFNNCGQHQQPLPSQHSKIHSSGLFYPPNSSSSVAAVQKKTVVAVGPGGGGAAAQRVIVSQNTPVVRHTSGNGEKTQARSRSTSKSKVCSRCGKSATYLCSGCHAEWYCGRDCQLKAWDAHADNCKA